MQLQCNCNATAMQLQCNCNATSMQLQCNCNATAMQLQCNLTPIQADNFDFWDKGTEKKKKKKVTARACRTGPEAKKLQKKIIFAFKTV